MMVPEMLENSRPSLRNLVLFKARKQSRMVLVECQNDSDRDFLRNHLQLRDDVLIQRCVNKENVLSFAEEVSRRETSNICVGLVDLDYDWALDDPPLYFEDEFICWYDAHSLESFEFFFGNETTIEEIGDETLQYAIDCAQSLGKIRAWNTWKSLDPARNFAGNMESMMQLFKQHLGDFDKAGFENAILNHFKLGPVFFNNTLAEHLASCERDRSYIIHGKDLRKMLRSIGRLSQFRQICSSNLTSRVRGSSLYRCMEDHEFLQTED